MKIVLQTIWNFKTCLKKKIIIKNSNKNNIFLVVISMKKNFELEENLLKKDF